MFRKRRSAEDFADELQAHLALEAERLVDSGVPAEEARLAARRRFGNVAAAQERYFESHRILWIDHLRQDARGAVRSIMRYPVAALVAIVSLAFGIGATAATLTVRNVIFHRPPPAYSSPEQLSKIQVAPPDRPIMSIGSYVPGPLYALWRETLGPAAVAAATPVRGNRDVRTADRTDTVAVRAASPDFFAVLGVAPALGRVFASSGAAEAVLTHRVWQRLFDGRRDAIGAAIWIDNRPYTVVGVLPPRFWFSDMSAPIWVPLERRVETSADEMLQVVARRPAGTSPDALAAQLQSGLTQYASGLAGDERRLHLKVSDINGTPIGDNVSVVLPYVLAACVLLTLLIACANVAILMIAQWTAREHEIAIRASLGASRGRIVRALLAESVLLAMAGGILGICVSFGLLGVIVHRGGGGDNALFNVAIDPWILMQSILITLLAGIVAGLAPALYETRRLHANPLCAMAVSDRVRQRWRHALVVFEIAVTAALLVVTVSMVAGYERARAARLGFVTRPVLTVRVENPAGVAVERLLEIVNRTPGVAGAAVSASVPMAAFGPLERVAADSAGSGAIRVERATITPGFFTVLDVPLRAGRAFTGLDSPATRTAIVSESLAKRFFPGGAAVGRQVWIDHTAYDIVGVTADYSNNPLQPEDYALKLFLPLAKTSSEAKRVQVAIRAKGDAGPLVQTVRREIRDAASGSTVTSAFTLDQILTVMGQEILVGTAPLAPLIAIGMFLTAAGIYGVLAFAITRRGRELAVRVAVGASGRDLVRLVSSQSVALVAAGSMAGIAVTFVLARIVRAGGGAGGIYDPSWPAFVIPIAIVFAIGLIATWIPSRRAMKINPAILLRTT
jgi:putative ABC transport system permease protein